MNIKVVGINLAKYYFQVYVEVVAQNGNTTRKNSRLVSNKTNGVTSCFLRF